MPWRGPTEPGEYPTLGWLVGEWIEAYCIVPSGPLVGQPFLLTGEQWDHLLQLYRLRPDAEPGWGSEAFRYVGAQLIRPQKWGKDPLGAANICVQAAGPVRFAGWDAGGEPVGAPVLMPYIQCAATSDAQTANTFRPVVKMFRDGPLSLLPGVDPGDTRVNLEGGGLIEPVTSAAKSRIGQPITWATLTESHLMLPAGGDGAASTSGVAMARAMKRNLAGMGGRWHELTNPWDPTEGSAAQLTYESGNPRVLVDYRPPRARVDVTDRDELVREIVYVYGDSAWAAGGWVAEERIADDVQDLARQPNGEGDARRFFLAEITSGSSDAVDAARWNAAARPGPLVAGELVTLGFDGSASRDDTALWICRVSDGRLFAGRAWSPAQHDGRIPAHEVDAAVTDAFAAYRVVYLFADPYLWRDYLNRWAAAWPTRLDGKAGTRVVEFPTNVETRMDKAVERFLTALSGGELTHDGSPVLTGYAFAAALAKGSKKRGWGDADTVRSGTHYLKLVKKVEGRPIDALVAAMLAYEARGRAVEDGWLTPKPKAPTPTVTRSTRPAETHELATAGF
jgi:hypothetical protein